MMRVGDILYQTSLRWPERDALLYGDQRYTYRQWNDRVNAVAAGFKKMGLERGDRVATFAFNSEALVTTALALQKLGLVYVPINFRLASEELDFILRDSGAKVLCFDEELATVVDSVGETVPIRIVYGDPAQSNHKALNFESIVNYGAGEPGVDVDPSDPSVVMYTSGTTGRPKGALLDHQAQWINTLLCALELGTVVSDRTLHMAPLYHVAAFHVMLLPHVLVGATNVILRKFSAETALKAIRDNQISTVLGVPTQYDQLASFLKGGTALTDSLRLAVTTGSLISGKTSHWVRRQMCANLICVYGMTECTSLLTILNSDQWSSVDNCIGRALLGVEARVVKLQMPIDVDCVVADGEPGVLVARTPKLMKGYFGRPDKTVDIIRGGWIITGDVVTRDHDGVFALIDRYDDMIISGGENVYPQEVERVLIQHPGVRDCVVIGVPDSTWGQLIKAFVVRNSADVNEKSLEDFCLDGRLARYKRPRYIEFVDEIPRNPSGKVLRKDLRMRNSRG